MLLLDHDSELPIYRVYPAFALNARKKSSSGRIPICEFNTTANIRRPESKFYSGIIRSILYVIFGKEVMQVFRLYFKKAKGTYY